MASSRRRPGRAPRASSSGRRRPGRATRAATSLSWAPCWPRAPAGATRTASPGGAPRAAGRTRRRRAWASPSCSTPCGPRPPSRRSQWPRALPRSRTRLWWPPLPSWACPRRASRSPWRCSRTPGRAPPCPGWPPPPRSSSRPSSWPTTWSPGRPSGRHGRRAPPRARASSPPPWRWWAPCASTWPSSSPRASTLTPPGTPRAPGRTPSATPWPSWALRPRAARAHPSDPRGWSTQRPPLGPSGSSSSTRRWSSSSSGAPGCWRSRSSCPSSARASG
mmetsp:Transcript_14965/g.50465  ORF Transcript_14965/g.50465 Transcript_14965/m.50465 type:complete len:277 (+) Transcript_14965:415-1245(+)